MIDFVLIQSCLSICLETMITIHLGINCRSEVSEYIEYSATQNQKLLANKHISFLL